MSTSVLIVEDEILVALQLEGIISDAGHSVVGIIPDHASLSHIPDPPQVALVDVNLRDGPTGPIIALRLSEVFGTKIVYVTANPQQIGEPAPTAVAIIEKPFSQSAILAAIACATGGLACEHLPAEVAAVSLPH
jgi:DNA-binding NtrC family response regulator